MLGTNTLPDHQRVGSSGQSSLKAIATHPGATHQSDAMRRQREAHSARFEVRFLEHPGIKEAFDLPIAFDRQEIEGLADSRCDESAGM